MRTFKGLLISVMSEEQTLYERIGGEEGITEMVGSFYEKVLADPVRFGPIERIDSFSGTLHALRPGKLVLFDGQIIDV